MTQEANPVMAAIAESVARGECILFLGAGVHYPPPEGSPYQYPDSERPPLGSALSRRLADGCGFSQRFLKESSDNLQRVSLYYETQWNRNKLVEQINDAVYVDKKPSPVLKGLARLNFPLVITTNFDQLFEKALIGAGKDPLKSIYSPDDFATTTDYDKAVPKSDRPFVVKIHGDIEKPESIVITDEDYIQFVMRMGNRGEYHPIPETFLFYFRRWPTVFVGYSLMDYNLRLLFKTLRWRIDKARIPATYSVDPFPDPLILDVWDNQRKYIKFITQDVWTFVPELYKMVIGEEMPP